VLFVFAFLVLPTAVLVSGIWLLILIRKGVILPERRLVVSEHAGSAIASDDPGDADGSDRTIELDAWRARPDAALEFGSTSRDQPSPGSYFVPDLPGLDEPLTAPVPAEVSANAVDQLMAEVESVGEWVTPPIDVGPAQLAPAVDVSAPTEANPTGVDMHETDEFVVVTPELEAYVPLEVGDTTDDVLLEGDADRDSAPQDDVDALESGADPDVAAALPVEPSPARQRRPRRRVQLRPTMNPAQPRPLTPAGTTRRVIRRPGTESAGGSTGCEGFAGVRENEGSVQGGDGAVDVLGGDDEGDVELARPLSDGDDVDSLLTHRAENTSGDAGGAAHAGPDDGDDREIARRHDRQ
jgi:hypothetical protein